MSSTALLSHESSFTVADVLRQSPEWCFLWLPESSDRSPFPSMLSVAPPVVSFLVHEAGQGQSLAAAYR